MPIFASAQMGPMFSGPTNIFSGMNNANNAIGGLLRNRMLGQYTQQYPQLLNDQVGMANNNLSTSDINLQTLPAMNQANLAAAQARPGLIGAQTNLANSQAQLAPLNTLIRAQQAAQVGSRFGGAYQLAKTLQSMSAPAREAWIAQNQDQYNAMLSTLGNTTGNASFITPDLINKYIPGAVNTGGGMAGTGAPANQGMPNIGGITGTQNFAPSTPDQTNQIALANNMAANKALTTGATQRQLEGAIQVENIANDPAFQGRIQDAANYAGALGKGQAAIDALSQTNPKAYENYLAVKNQDMPLLLNRIKTLDQMGATDKQREDLENLYNTALTSLTSNPAQFITQFNKLGNMLDTISQSVQKSATPIAPVNRLSGFKPIGSASVQMPTFSSDPQMGKQQFQAWYRQQSPAAQAAIRQQLGGK